MLETLLMRAEHAARKRVRQCIKRLAVQLRERVPQGVDADPVDEGVQISGRRLRVRFVLDPGLRWLAERLVR